MVKSATLHLILTVMFILLGLTVPLIPEFRGIEAVMLCPVLFCTLLSSMICGTLESLLISVSVPFLTWAIFRTGDLKHEVCLTAASLMAASLFSGTMYRRLRTSFGAALTGTLALFITYAVGRTVFCYMEGDYYTVSRFLEEAVLTRWPGLLLCVIGVPLLILLFRKQGVTRVLRHEKDER